MRLSIRVKLVVLIAFLLVCAVLALAGASIHLSKQDNSGLIQQLNAETTSNLAAESYEFLGGAVRKTRLLLEFLRPESAGSLPAQQVVQRFFQDNEEVLGLLFASQTKAGELQISASFFSPSAGRVDLGQAVRKTLTLPEGGELGVTPFTFAGLPSIALALPVHLASASARSLYWAVTLIDARRLLQRFAASGTARSFLVDKNGRAVLIPGEDLSRRPLDFSHLEIVHRLLTEKTDNGQTGYADPETGVRRLGAYHRVGLGGLSVVSEVPESRISEAVFRLLYRSILLAMVVLCVSFITGYLFAGTITAPLKDLVLAAQRITKGDFQIHLRPRTRDEVADLSYAFNAMARGLEERDRVKETFSKYHDKEIARELLAGKTNLGGEAMDATILFTDLRGFTAMSEVLPAARVVDLLNEYFTRMVTIIKEHHGRVDKFVGDAMLVTWGVPRPSGDDAFRAVACCLEMRAELARLNDTRVRRHEVPLKIGMGLNRGRVIAGNIGSNERLEYTVIGDAVNVASRVQSLTKDFNTDLLVTWEVYEHVSHKFAFEPCRGARVKGKSAEIETFKVLGFSDRAGQRYASRG